MRARLLVESGVASPRVCDLDESAVVLLGRNRENTILLQDRRASRSHARIYYRDGRFHIGHQGEPTNGTRIDGRPLEDDVPLSDGQMIAIGEIRIRFVMLSEEPTDDSLLVRPSPLESSDTTMFEADELTVLFRFMNDSLGETRPARLVSLALDAVRQQTGADLDSTPRPPICV
jgi:pSer/pThr/pTyr-binding forkhead associated (FHA) protein